MGIIKIRSQEERADFFKKNKWVIERLTSNANPQKKKAVKTEAAPKATKKKSSAKKQKTSAAKAPDTPQIVAKTETVESSQKDNLTMIPGLGAVMASRLEENGITSFEQMAKMTKRQIKKLGKDIRGLESGFTNKDWKNHAKNLMQK